MRTEKAMSYLYLFIFYTIRNFLLMRTEKAMSYLLSFTEKAMSYLYLSFGH